MNIALFASAFHPSLGGVEELCRQLSHALRRLGHRVIILTNRWPRNLPEFEEFEGLRVYRLAFRVPTGHWRANLSHALTSHIIQSRLHAILEKNSIDLIHVQCVSCHALYAARAADALELPFVVTLQGELTMDAGGAFLKEGTGRNIMRLCLESAHAITACSRNTLLEAEHFFGSMFGARGNVIYNGIRLADFEAVRPFCHLRPYILGLGRHVPQKGFDILLHAFAKCVQNGLSELDLVLAGDGPDHDSLVCLARSLGIEPRVHFVGGVDRRKAMELFSGCEFFVLPSRHEPFGIVNLEAMASGKAVIATAVGGVPELVGHDETGLLVPGADVPALTAAIFRLAHDQLLRRRLAANGIARAAQFDWDRIASEYLGTYSQAFDSPEADTSPDSVPQGCSV